MDPQGRLLLEQSATALRDANLRLDQDMDANTGVYIGVMHMEFIQYMNGEHLTSFILLQCCRLEGDTLLCVADCWLKCTGAFECSE